MSLRRLPIDLLAAATLLRAAPASAQEPEPEPEPEAEPEPGAGPEQARHEASADLLAMLRKEPTVREVQQAALEYFRVNPGRVRSLAAKARVRWLIPELSGSFRNELGDRDSRLTDFFYVDTIRARTMGATDVKEQTIEESGAREWQVTASWSLRGLLFDNAELDVYSLVGVQESLLREVTTLYYTRRRMQVTRALNPPQDDIELMTEALREEELTATLDALTGGLFTRRLGGDE